VPQGIYIQSPKGGDLIYIGLADTGYNTTLDQMLDLFNSPSFGVYGFGALSVDYSLRAMTGNTFKHEAKGMHTLIQGPFKSAP